MALRSEKRGRQTISTRQMRPVACIPRDDRSAEWKKSYIFRRIFKNIPLITSEISKQKSVDYSTVRAHIAVSW
jgi:hypothetical protein